MSANVWHEEVCAGLKTEIENTVRIKDAKRQLIPLPKPEKSIVVRKPEEDLKFEVYPCVSIYLGDSSFDYRRYSTAQHPCIIERLDKTHQLEAEEQAVPFNLALQIDFWAKYQEDMDTMTRTWLKKHFQQFNLDVVDDGGTPRSVNCIARGTLVKSDLVVNKERLFHSIANYTIWVEIDDETRYNMPMVTQIGIGVESKQD